MRALDGGLEVVGDSDLVGREGGDRAEEVDHGGQTPSVSSCRAATDLVAPSGGR